MTVNHQNLRMLMGFFPPKDPTDPDLKIFQPARPGKLGGAMLGGAAANTPRGAGRAWRCGFG